MTCEQIEVWISAAQDGELDPRRQRQVEDHLATCADCRELAACIQAGGGASSICRGLIHDRLDLAFDNDGLGQRIEQLRVVAFGGVVLDGALAAAGSHLRQLRPVVDRPAHSLG